ncbi:MAG TPA: hypothetical protein VEF71_26930 [Streptosporangiaceae bacterium]|nr:hypothetical protein [Streptosporangiaceae bacterium]
MAGTQPAAEPPPVTAAVTARRSRLSSLTPASLLAGLVLVLLGLAVALGIAGQTGSGLAFVAPPVAVLGLVIARRQPGNRIGLLLLGCSAVFALYGDATAYSVWDYHRHGGRLPLGPAAVVIAELWTAVFLVLPLVVLLFPDGRLPSRWRIVGWAYLADCALITAIFVAGAAWEVSRAPIVVDGHGQLVHTLGPNDVPLIVFVILFGAVPVFWVLFVARQVLSWRRASGERRVQLKWLMAGSAATVIGLAGGAVLGTSNLLLNVLDSICLAVGIFSLPVCISFAILKYHLYDIDRLISRTLSYTLVTGLLIGVYAGVVTFATRVLPFHSTVGVAASTLAVAALFNPLRRRVQRMVDRRFNRARYDADRTVAAFASRLKDEVDLDSIRADLAGVVHHALEPAHVSVWLSPPD